MHDCKLFTKPQPSETSGLRRLTRTTWHVTGTELGQSGEQWLPLAFPSCPFRGLPPGATPAALPSPILRRLASTSQSRAPPGSGALRRGSRDALGGTQEPGVRRGRWRGGWGGHGRRSGAKRPFIFPLLKASRMNLSRLVCMMVKGCCVLCKVLSSSPK